MRMPTAAIVIALLFGANSASGGAFSAAAQGEQPRMPAFVRVIDEAFAALKHGKYLAAIDLLEREAKNPAHGPDSPVEDLWFQTHAFIGGTVDKAVLRATADEPVDAQTAERIAAAEFTDAVDEIVRRAGSTRIVILNEAHHSPRDRAFALAVAKALRPLGYSVLAAESFANDRDADASFETMAEMARDGYPRLKHGLYVKDPVFGDFVRQSLALGYRPVAYEYVAEKGAPPPPNPIEVREREQSNNLVERIFARDSDAKVLILAGHSHVAEEPIGSGRPQRWMAARLKQATGIDPLTIDQTTISETAREAEFRRLYGIVAPRIRDRAVLLTSGSGMVKIGPYAEAVDLQVVHPPLRTVAGRPAWMMSMGRKPIAVPESLLPRSGRRLIQAFIEGEADDAIPVDQIIVESGKEPPALMLPDVAIRYEVQDPT